MQALPSGRWEVYSFKILLNCSEKRFVPGSFQGQRINIKVRRRVFLLAENHIDHQVLVDIDIVDLIRIIAELVS